MDGLIIVGIAIWLAYERNKEVQQISNEHTKNLEVKKNPNFYRDENAFLKLYNAIMKSREE